ncbi:MAG: hypothetical protein RLZZ401_1938 [Pseudomonadota bacterium]
MIFRRLIAIGLPVVLGLMACASAPESPSPEPWRATPWAAQSGVVLAGGQRVEPEQPASQWAHFRLPGKKATEFSGSTHAGRDAMAVWAASSASMLRRRVQLAPDHLGRVRFSWNVPELIATGDMSNRDFDDSPVRMVFAFDGDRTQFSPKNALLNELTLALTGEPMPYAVLMYVWSKQRPLGTIIPSPRTDRIRKLVVESGPRRLNQWLDFERDLAADFERAFQEPAGALVGMGIMTDTDNTRTTARAWYGPLVVQAR